MTANDDIRQQRHLIDQLRRSQVYREYEKAFRDCTGLPLSLRSGECFGLAHQGDPRENPFCAMLAARNTSCAACLEFQQQLISLSQAGASTRECHAGLTESAVPVRVGDRVVAYLQTGQMLLQRPTAAHIRNQVQRLKGLGLDTGNDELIETYLRTRVVPARQYEAILRLLVIFAQQLGGLSNQLAMQEEHVEQPAIAQARAYILENHAAELTLTSVAAAVKMSACHFCKSFRKSTGLTFTHYLARVRVERVRQSLLNPHVRISEAAYAAGFQSLSQFSRVFRRIAGESPSSFRSRLNLGKSA